MRTRLPAVLLVTVTSLAGCLGGLDEDVGRSSIAGLGDAPVAKVADPWYYADGTPNMR